MTRRHRRRPVGVETARHLLAAVALGALTLACDARSARAQGAVRPDARAVRVAVFNSRTVFDSMPERRGAESEFALEQAKARTMLAAATDSLRLAVEEFAKLEPSLSPRHREATAMHLRARELLVEEMAANLDHLILRRQAELQQPLRERVRQAVQTVRERLGVELVLDRAGDGVVFDAAEHLDITREILRELGRQNKIARSPVK